MSLISACVAIRASERIATKYLGEKVFSERIRGLGLRNALVIGALLVASAVVFTHSAGADDPAFAPTITLQTSTTRAAAHPDARITIDNSQSSEQIKDLTIDLPDGMMGSLNAAVPCTVAQATATNCPDTAQIGTVTNYAKVDNSDVVLAGKVYLTDALPLTAGKIDTENGSPNTEDPASMQVVVPGKIGGVDMGNVVVNARVQIRHAAIASPWADMPAGTLGPVVGVRTVVNDVPDHITDDNTPRTVTFSLTRMVVDLKSDQSPPRAALLTNSSNCTADSISLTADGYDSSNATDTQSYTPTDCDKVHVSDAAMTFTSTNQAPGGKFGFTQTLEFPADQPSTRSMTVQFPPSVAPNTNAFGEDWNQCPTTSISTGAGGQNVFNAAECPSEAKIGTVEIQTPLLPDPLEGYLYLITSSPLPNLGIWVDPTTGSNNPAGVTIGLYGKTYGTNAISPNCLPIDYSSCLSGLAASFDYLPDAPMTKITVVNDPAARDNYHDDDGNPIVPPDPPNGTIQGSFLKNATKNDSNCLPVSDVQLDFTSWTSGLPTTGKGAGIAPLVQKGATPTGDCKARSAVMVDDPDTTPYGKVVSSVGALQFFNATATPAVCGLDFQKTLATSCDPVSGVGSFTPSPSPAAGIHHFFVQLPSPPPDSAVDQLNYRAFVIKNPEPSDTTAPTVTLSNEPGATTADTTPSVDFSSDEDAYFQCSIDDGPYLPCDTTPGTPAQSGSYTVPSALIPNDDTHTIDVRAQDAAGNVSTAQSTSFKVDVPLDPTLDIDLSTTKARAHPTMDLTVTSGSHEDIKNLKLSMPDGFMGSLNGVTALCPIAVANAGNCTDASQVGTVDTEAIVDQSTVRISGKVFMTDPIALGDPAGLYVDVPAKIQSIDEGHVLVPVRLAVRGEAEGIDSFATDLPTGLDPALWQNPQLDQPSEFDLRSMTLKLRNNPSASQPLLTNPSGCTPDQFSATFTGYGSTVVSKNVAFQSTDCGALAFTPSLNITQKDSSTGGVPGASTNVKVTNVDFTATVNANPNDAGIKNVDLILPRGMTIDVGHLPYPCQPEEAAAKACPATSAIGDVVAISPLLPEPLKGTVYVLKSTTSLPRMLIALRGRINVDLTASNSFYNINQIHTTMDSLPDVPLSSFTMNVNKFLRTQNWLCEDTTPAEWKIVGSMTGQNSASQGVNIPLNFNCPKAPKPSVKVRFSGSGKNFSARVYATAPKGSKITGATISLPSGVKIRSSVRRSTKQMGKYLPVYVDHRKLRTQCYGKRTSSRFDIKANKKSAKRIKVWFKKGSLTTHKKFTRKHPPKFKIKLRLKDASGKTISVNARTRAYYRGVRAQSTRKLVKRTSVDPC